MEKVVGIKGDELIDRPRLPDEYYDEEEEDDQSDVWLILDFCDIKLAHYFYQFM